MHEITDMYFVATLISYGADYIGVDRADKRNQKFLFNEPIGIDKIHIFDHGTVKEIASPTFEQVRDSYDTLKLLYPPSYADAVRKVKGIIHT